ncbi:MAG: penicillin acylase family protein [Ktedonobacteraceae bacterium]|nr:penicillin acylase family protein [Ktedonobacteraceae bacterium]
MASWWQKTRQTASNLSGLAAGTYSLWTHRSLTSKSGDLHLQGLHETVEIITDRYGVPHIYASNEDDLYFAQGYIHAQERLWQMEFNRRIASGRLSEIFGSLTLELDRFCRRIGMHRAAAIDVDQLAEHDRRILEAYSSGVNSFIQLNTKKLPVEFTLLHLQPALWKPADTLQWGKLQAWSLGGNWETELIRARLVAKLGAERASRLEAGYDPAHPLIIPSGVAYQGINPGLLEQYEQIKTLSGLSALGGSNNWVVDGTMTASGASILCNDPHLGQAVPSVWFECHLNAGDIDVIGASFPGSPGVIIGHNQHIAWGVTNAVSDVQDLYVEKFNPENPHQYEFMGSWQEAQIIREEIVVKDQAMPVVEEVRVTRHGPVITSLPQVSQGQAEMTELPLALRWTALDQGKIVAAVQNLNRATNWDEFRTALYDWDAPPQNFVYGDTAGNIGYVMAGAIPIRAKGQALLPVPGWTGEYEWTGLIPFEELPQTFNPEQHMLVTANNRVIDDSYPYYITHEWLNGYRAQRIRDLLTGKENLTLDDMAQIQSDQYSLPATAIVPFILQIDADTPMKRAAQDILRAWNYVLEPDSIGASIYITFLNKLESITLGAVIGDDETLISHYRGVGMSILSTLNGYASRTKPLMIRLLREQDDRWFADSVIANGPRSWSVALARAFDATIDELSVKLGNNVLHWQYSAIHKLTYNHPLGMIKPLDAIFNRGPFPFGGDSDTVSMGNTSPQNPTKVIVVPSYRQIVDLGELANSRSIHAPGQSGHPADKHYDDFIKLWQENKHHTMLFTREAIESEAEATLFMHP